MHEANKKDLQTSISKKGLPTLVNAIQLGGGITQTTNLKEIILQNFNTSDGVLYSVFDDYGFGNISDPVACTAVDVGDLDVTLTKE